MTDTLTQPDVVDLLIEQHTQIRDLFTEVESSTAAARRNAFHRLVTLLAVHEIAEEQVVHPLTRLHVDGGDDIVDDRLAEGHQVKQTLAALKQLDSTRRSSRSCSTNSASVSSNTPTMRKPTNSAICAATSRPRNCGHWRPE